MAGRDPPEPAGARVEVPEGGGGEALVRVEVTEGLVGDGVGRGEIESAPAAVAQGALHQVRDERRAEVVAYRVEDRHVEAVGVEGVVEAVACHLVCRLDDAGHRHLRGHQRHGRQVRPLELGGQRHRPVAAGELDGVAVVPLRDHQLRCQRGHPLDRSPGAGVGCCGQVDPHHAEARRAVEQGGPHPDARLELLGVRALPSEGATGDRAVDLDHRPVGAARPEGVQAHLVVIDDVHARGGGPDADHRPGHGVAQGGGRQRVRHVEQPADGVAVRARRPGVHHGAALSPAGAGTP